MFNSTLSVYEIHEKVMRKTRLLDRVRHAIRVRQYSLSMEKIYIAWIRLYILFHGSLRLRVSDLDIFRYTIRVHNWWIVKYAPNRLTPSGA